MPRTAEAADAAVILRRMLAEVEAGNISDGGPHGSHLMQRLRGAVAALDAIGRSSSREAITRRELGEDCDPELGQVHSGQRPSGA